MSIENSISHMDSIASDELVNVSIGCFHKHSLIRLLEKNDRMFISKTQESNRY